MQRFHVTFCIFVRVLRAKIDWEARGNFTGYKIQHLRVLCYFGLEKLKEESYVGHFDNGSKITSPKKILVSTRTPESRKKATISLIMSACPYALPRETHFPVDRHLWLYYTEKFYYNSVQKNEIWLLSDKNITHFTCDLLLLIG